MSRTTKYQFEEVDDDDEPTSWSDVEAHEPKYQSLKLLAFPTAAAGSAAGSAGAAPASGAGAGDTSSAVAPSRTTSGRTTSSGVVGSTSTPLLATATNAAAAAAAAASDDASRMTLIDDPLQVIEEKIATNNSIESADFDAKRFLAEVHAATSYEDLMQGTEALSSSLRSEEQQIKQLVSNNFNKFIQSKDTIDAVVRQINKNEAKSFGEEIDSNDSKAVAQRRALVTSNPNETQLSFVYGELVGTANAIYKPILSNVAEMIRLKSLLAQIDRFQFLFQLPARVRRNISLNEKEKVLRDYEKARRLVRSSNCSLFEKIFLELEAQIFKFVEALYSDLRAIDINTHPDEAERLIRLIDEFSVVFGDQATKLARRVSTMSIPLTPRASASASAAAATTTNKPNEPTVLESPAAFYLRHRFASLLVELESAPLSALVALGLTREVEFIEKFFQVGTLIRRTRAQAKTRSSSQRSSVDVDGDDDDDFDDADLDVLAGGDDDEEDRDGDDVDAKRLRQRATVNSGDVVHELFVVVDAFMARLLRDARAAASAAAVQHSASQDGDDDVDDASRVHTMRTTLRAASALLDGLRRRALSNAPTDTNSAPPQIVRSATRRSRQQQAKKTRRPRTLTTSTAVISTATGAPVSPWLGATHLLVRAMEKRLLRATHRLVSEHNVAASASIAFRLVAQWRRAALGPVRSQLRRATALAARDVRQRRFEQSLHPAPPIETNAAGEAIAVATNLLPTALGGAGADDDYARLIRDHLGLARRLVGQLLLLPLREAASLVALSTLEDVRRRVLAVVELVVGQLYCAAAEDDSGLIVLHVVDALNFVRARFVSEMLSLFASQLEPVVDALTVDGGTSGDDADIDAVCETKAPSGVVRLLRELESTLTRSYVRLQAAHIDAIVADGLLRSGTNWFFYEATALRTNDFVIKLLLRLVAAHHQVSTRCASLLDDVISALFEAILSSFVANLPSIECFDGGGLLQMQIDVAFVESTLSRYSSPRTTRLVATLHRALELAARTAGVESNSSDNARLRRAALEQSRRSTRVLFACFDADDDDADADNDDDRGDEGKVFSSKENKSKSIDAKLQRLR